MTDVKPIRVGVVDDQYVVRMMMTALLEQDERFEFVGEAGDGEAAIALCRDESPDVLILDLEMPVMDGLTALPEIRRVAPGCKVVILSGMGMAHEERARALGAAAFVAKGTALPRVAELLLSVAEAEGIEPTKRG